MITHDSLRLLRLEALACEVTGLLRRNGVDSILLKGPVTNRWLYEGPDARPFRDIDLLVQPRDAQRSHEVLADQGFVDFEPYKLGIHRLGNETTWVRGDVVVDLHTRLIGVDPRRAGESASLLFASSAPFVLHGSRLLALCEVDRLVHLGLHAAQSVADEKADRDLERGLDRYDSGTWSEARLRARQLNAEASFCLGLQRSGRGADLVRGWEDVPVASLEARLRAKGSLIEAVMIASLGGHPTGARLAVMKGWLRVERPGGLRRVDRLAAGGRLVAGLGQVLRELAGGWRPTGRT